MKQQTNKGARMTNAADYLKSLQDAWLNRVNAQGVALVENSKRDSIKVRKPT